MAGLQVIGERRCHRCGAPAERSVDACRECRGRRLGFATARGLLMHEGSGRKLVHRFKDGGLPRLSVHAGGLITMHVRPAAVEAVTWVPPDRWRTIRRGYHPAELLAREVARRWSMAARPLLRARRHRRPQRGLGNAERRANVRDAFAVCSPPPKAVLLVDDVYTTGATLAACAAVLRRAGAGEVYALTLARAVRGS